MTVTWMNNVRNMLIKRINVISRKKGKQHFSPANQSQVADKALTVVTNFDC